MSNTSHFTPNTRVGHHPKQLAAEIDGQMVVMGLSQGKYVGFDDIATTIWRRLEQTPSVGELYAGLTQDFAGDPAVIRQDVDDLLALLDEFGLIVTLPDGGEAGAPST